MKGQYADYDFVLAAQKATASKENNEIQNSMNEMTIPTRNFPLRRSLLLFIIIFILPLFIEQVWAQKVAASTIGVILARKCSRKIHSLASSSTNKKIPPPEKSSSVNLDPKRSKISVKKRFLDGIAARKILADLDEQERRIEQVNKEIRLARESERLEEGKSWALKAISTTKEAQRKAEEQLRKEEFERRKAKAWAASITKTSGVDVTKE